MPKLPHRHHLYEASVQCVEADNDFIANAYRKHRGEKPRMLREDFCGTAALCCDWVKRSRRNQAWGVDIHGPTLEWGRRHHLALLGPEAERVVLLERDVRAVTRPVVDAVAAFNFSYWIFKTRQALLGYFRKVHSSLAPRGMFFLDAYGGTEAEGEQREKRKIKASTAPDGTELPTFRYIWETARFNTVDHHVLNYIHFELPGGQKINRAFRYDWRLWSLPELCELLLEAGFARAEVYFEGWDEEAEESDGVFRRRTYFENQEGWVAYVIGLV